MLTTDEHEARLRARLHDYGSALEVTVRSDGGASTAGPTTTDRVARVGGRSLRPWAVAAAVALVVGLAAVAVMASGGQGESEVAVGEVPASESRWFRSGATPAGALDPGAGPGSTSPGGWQAIDPATIDGWADLRDLLGPDAVSTIATTRGRDVLNLGFRVDGLELGLTFQRLESPVVLPVSADELEAGFRSAGGVESFVGETVDGMTLGQVVQGGGRSVSLSVAAAPVAVAEALGDLEALLTAADSMVEAP